MRIFTGYDAPFLTVMPLSLQLCLFQKLFILLTLMVSISVLIPSSYPYYSLMTSFYNLLSNSSIPDCWCSLSGLGYQYVFPSTYHFPNQYGPFNFYSRYTDLFPMTYSSVCDSTLLATLSVCLFRSCFHDTAWSICSPWRDIS